jgi:hypothetical protein
MVTLFFATNEEPYLSRVTLKKLWQIKKQLEQPSVRHMPRSFYLQQQKEKLKGDKKSREQRPCAMRHRGRAGRHQAEVDVVVLVPGGRLVLRIEHPKPIHHSRGSTKDRINMESSTQQRSSKLP